MATTVNADHEVSLAESLEMAQSSVACLNGIKCETSEFTNKIMGRGTSTNMIFDELHMFLQELGRMINTEIYTVSDLRDALRSGKLNR